MLFHLKLWDYSARFLNINGRVCLKNSLLFGVMAVVTVFWIHPHFSSRVTAVPAEWMILITGVLIGVLIADLVLTVYTILKMNGRLKQIQAVAEELSENTKRFGEELQKQVEERKEQVSDRLSRLKEKGVDGRENPRFFERRMLRAFPHMRQTRYPEALEKLKRALGERKSKDK